MELTRLDLLDENLHARVGSSHVDGFKEDVLTNLVLLATSV